MAKAKHTPWRVEPWVGGEGFTAGFYVARTRLSSRSTEWMRNEIGMPRRFRTEQAARTAIAKVTGSTP